LYTDGSPEDYELPGKPGTPNATPVDTTSVNLTWAEPEHGTEAVISYKVWFRTNNKGKPSHNSTNESSPNEVMKFCSTPTAETQMLIQDLLPGTKYQFQVQAVSDLGVFSTKSDSCCGKTKDIPRPADLILMKSKLIENGPPAVYKLPLVLVDHDKAEGLYKYTIGTAPRTANPKPERVFMVLGATGAGKSTMLNGIANYVLGVDFGDPFRFKVVTDEGSGTQAHSQTKTITAYTFYSTALPYTLTIIDTPGFGDTGGIERDKYIAKQIKMFFAGRDRGGIDVLHGIGFVTQSSLARLTPTQKYIFDAVLAIFGKDIVDNIFLMATFADANAPQVLEAVKAAKIPFQRCFKFNNSALFADIDSDGSYFNSMFWKMGVNSFADFFGHFSKAEMKSLALTREVLKEREQLETLVPGLQVQVKVGLNKMDAIKQEEDALKFHQDSIIENKDFQYPVTVQKIDRVDLPLGTNTTTCRNCNFTCHNGCAYSDDRDKAGCCAKSGGSCTICPNKCHWSNHSNVPYRIDYSSETVMKTYDSKKALHDKAESGKQRVERLLAEKQEELETLQYEVYRLIKQVQESNERLREIALKPNPLTETDYLELLIKSEESERKQGWKERVVQYKVLVKEAQVLKKASAVEIKDRKDKGMWKSMWNTFSSSVSSAVGYGKK
jgi:GTP-binding protein EngB required for normal cell division